MIAAGAAALAPMAARADDAAYPGPHTDWRIDHIEIRNSAEKLKCVSAHSAHKVLMKGWHEV
ncbi:MAG: hypothetical protein AAGJ87_07335, partial [Pseudomonadota bacterium]